MDTNPNMRILGVTWVIISMKLIYGLVLDLWHWGWLDDFSFADENDLLGALLLLGVVLNIVIGSTDEDAIAAQATLILLVVRVLLAQYTVNLVSQLCRPWNYFVTWASHC